MENTFWQSRAGTHCAEASACAGFDYVRFAYGVLSAQTLEHRYSFDEAVGSTNATDSVGGTNWDGYLVGNAYITNDTVVLPFTQGSTSASPAGYVQLPNGIITNDASITVECWLTDSSGQTWAEAWCFGDSSSGPGNPPSGGTTYLGMIPTSAANGLGPVDYRAAFNLTNGPGEEDVIDLAGKTMPTNMEVYSVVAIPSRCGDLNGNPLFERRPGGLCDLQCLFSDKFRSDL